MCSNLKTRSHLQFYLFFFLMVSWVVGFLCIKTPPLKTSNLKAKVLGCISQSSKHVGFPTQPFGSQHNSPTYHIWYNYIPPTVFVFGREHSCYFLNSRIIVQMYYISIRIKNLPLWYSSVHMNKIVIF